jgi:hypothetical protein
MRALVVAGRVVAIAEWVTFLLFVVVIEVRGNARAPLETTWATFAVVAYPAAIAWVVVAGALRLRASVLSEGPRGPSKRMWAAILAGLAVLAMLFVFTSGRAVCEYCTCLGGL